MLDMLILYTSLSVGMTIVNKSCMLLLNHPLLVVTCQMICGACLALCTCKVKIRKEQYQWVLFVPVLIFVMIWSSMYAIQVVSIGTFVVIRNTIPLCTICLERIVFGHKLTKMKIIGSIFIILGSIVYYHDNIYINEKGILSLLLNVLASSIDRIVEKYLLDSIEIDKITIAFVNNAFGVFPLLYSVMFTHTTLVEFTNHLLKRPKHLLLLCTSSIIGVCLNMVCLKIQARVSPSDMTIINTINKLFLIIGGMIIYHESRSLNALLGILLSFTGCLLFYCEQVVEIWKNANVSTDEKSVLIHRSFV